MTTPDELGALLATMPFALGVGVELLAAAPERCTIAGALHGGALMTLADSVGAVCAYLNLPLGAGTTTVESGTHFLRAVRAGSVTAVSRPLHAGRTLVVVQTDLLDDDGRRVAQVTQSQAVLPGRE